MGLETEFPSEFQTPAAPPTVYVDEKEQPWDVKEGGELKVPESFVWPDAMQPKVAFNEYVDVPLIDLAPCHTGDEIGIQKVVKEVDAACREWGAFQVINHGIPDDVVLRAREAMKRGFTCHPRSSSRHSGITSRITTGLALAPCFALASSGPRLSNS
ncbi:unnamed protein product [Sphagnum troendelagicum]|uniref:Non-haem dioxygenase N-terminal domain-containing protein n=1 Tax=Sphagnum troendelagicum TaxID=128251 RepID=A0ABP0T999_9BRYO